VGRLLPHRIHGRQSTTRRMGACTKGQAKTMNSNRGVKVRTAGWGETSLVWRKLQPNDFLDVAWHRLSKGWSNTQDRLIMLRRLFWRKCQEGSKRGMTPSYARALRASQQSAAQESMRTLNPHQDRRPPSPRGWRTVGVVAIALRLRPVPRRVLPRKVRCAPHSTHRQHNTSTGLEGIMSPSFREAAAATHSKNKNWCVTWKCRTTKMRIRAETHLVRGARRRGPRRGCRLEHRRLPLAGGREQSEELLLAAPSSRWLPAGPPQRGRGGPAVGYVRVTEDGGGARVGTAGGKTAGLRCLLGRRSKHAFRRLRDLSSCLVGAWGAIGRSRERWGI